MLNDQNRRCEFCGSLTSLNLNPCCLIVRPDEYAEHFDKSETPLPPEFRCSITGMEFILIRGGAFMMGNQFVDGCRDEIPVHEITIKDFYLAKYPVTQQEWTTVMKHNPSCCGNGDRLPVDSISCDMALDFIQTLNLMQPKTADFKPFYRLPAEAEWEYAARDGGQANRFPGGATPSKFAWYCANSDALTHPVGQKNPNGLGLYDMAGNVWEWCADWYIEDSYKNSDGSYPQPERRDSQQRVLRGGSWQSVETCLRTTFRSSDAPMNDYWQYGLRLAVTIREFC